MERGREGVLTGLEPGAEEAPLPGLGCRGLRSKRADCGVSPPSTRPTAHSSLSQQRDLHGTLGPADTRGVPPSTAGAWGPAQLHASLAPGLACVGSGAVLA